jgi:hypothetical protein
MADRRALVRETLDPTGVVTRGEARRLFDVKKHVEDATLRYQEAEAKGRDEVLCVGDPICMAFVTGETDTVRLTGDGQEANASGVEDTVF